MATGPATAERPEAPLFADGLGERVVAVDAATGDLLQILRVRPQLLAVPSFEFALRERAARLANFRHAYYARVRRIDRHPTGLAIVSDHVEGVRLSEMLRVAHARGLHLDLNAALCLLRQLVPSLALLHENARDVAHGLVAPERLIVTPRARLIVVEHVLGSAVEQLQFKRERLWQELRVAVPSSAGAIRFDHRADVTAIGLTALALVLGRPLADDEYPHRAATLLGEARARVPPAAKAAAARGAAHLDCARPAARRPPGIHVRDRRADWRSKTPSRRTRGSSPRPSRSRRSCRATSPRCSTPCRRRPDRWCRRRRDANRDGSRLRLPSPRRHRFRSRQCPSRRSRPRRCPSRPCCTYRCRPRLYPLHPIRP